VLVGPKITLADDLQRLSARFERRLPDVNAMLEIIAQEAKGAIRFGMDKAVDDADAATRAEIFRLHLTRRKLDAAKFDLAKLAEASEGFSGAEIERAIVSGLYEAHASGQPLNTVHVLTETVRTRPLSVVMAKKSPPCVTGQRTVPYRRIDSKYLFLKTLLCIG
jgi:SpoVK/Ycf46/Vps4 family AAA+-type ATPase